MGTSAGTIVCAGVAGAIAIAAKRAGDLTARYGGEEFAVVLPKTSAEGANVTLSGDSATAIPSAQESPDTLILRADSALYQAKTQGKNRIFHASINSESSTIFM